MSCEINSPNNDNESIYSSDSLAREEDTPTSKFTVSSDVWKFFEKICHSQNNVVTEYKCTLCTQTYATGNATTSLQRHLNNKHSTRYQKPESRQTTLKDLRYKSYTKKEFKLIIK